MPTGEPCVIALERLIDIDRCGERLIGCVECNRWSSSRSAFVVELSIEDSAPYHVEFQTTDKSLWRAGAMIRDTPKDERLEQARKKLFSALEELRSAGTLTSKECDAVEAALEDELIALRVSPLLKK
jgi:hypothetical protein